MRCIEHRPSEAGRDSSGGSLSSSGSSGSTREGGLSLDAAEQKATQEFGDPEGTGARLGVSQGRPASLVSDQAVFRAGVLMIGLAFLWLGFSFDLINMTFGSYQSASLSMLLSKYGIFGIYLSLHVIAGFGLLHARRWSRVATLLLLPYNLVMFIFTCVNTMTYQTRVFTTSALPVFVGGVVSGYILWALVRPRAWRLAWT